MTQIGLVRSRAKRIRSTHRLLAKPTLVMDWRRWLYEYISQKNCVKMEDFFVSSFRWLLGIAFQVGTHFNPWCTGMEDTQGRYLSTNEKNDLWSSAATSLVTVIGFRGASSIDWKVFWLTFLAAWSSFWQLKRENRKKRKLYQTICSIVLFSNCKTMVGWNDSRISGIRQRYWIRELPMAIFLLIPAAIGQHKGWDVEHCFKYKAVCNAPPFLYSLRICLETRKPAIHRSFVKPKKSANWTWLFVNEIRTD